MKTIILFLILTLNACSTVEIQPTEMSHEEIDKYIYEQCIDDVNKYFARNPQAKLAITAQEACE